MYPEVGGCLSCCGIVNVCPTVSRTQELLSRYIAHDGYLMSDIQFFCDQNRMLMDQMNDLENVTGCLSASLADSDLAKMVLERKLERLSVVSGTLGN